MTRLPWIRWSLIFLTCGLVAVLDVQGDDPPKKTDEPIIIIDSAGKEQKVKGWKIVAGTRRLSWLAPPKKEDKIDDKDGKKPAKPKAAPPSGPEALEVREENSTTFVDGVLTLVPLTHIRAITFDNDKQLISVRVVKSDKPEGDEVLTGITKYRGINKISIEAEIDKGDMGIAELKFNGGVAKGIRGISFPAPKPAAKVEGGRAAQVTVIDKPQKTVHKVADLLPLYRLTDGSERLMPTLMFKKTLKLDVSQIQKAVLGELVEKEGFEWTVTMKDGTEQTLTLLRVIEIEGQNAVLEGMLGRVPAGYKLFPIQTANEIQFEEK